LDRNIAKVFDYAAHELIGQYERISLHNGKKSVFFFFVKLFFFFFFFFFFPYRKFVRLLAAPFDIHYAQLLANVAASSQKGITQQHALLNFSTPSSRLVEARTKRGEHFAVALSLVHCC
jgi:hypothetical protein